MRKQILLFGYLCSILVNGVPVPETEKSELELVQIPINSEKELDILSIGESSQLNERNKRTIGILRDLFPEISKLNGENEIDLSALNQRLEETIRVARQANGAAAPAADAANPNENSVNTDQQAEESKSPALDELTLDSDENEADDRNKRFLLPGLSGSSGSSGGDGSSGGSGSGNFLFDIIRQTADRAARAAGTVYRVIAGTESLDLNGTNSGISQKNQQKPQQLFSGSSATQTQDDNSNSDDGTGDDSSKSNSGDGYTEGIPGPVTRLFVLANRGLSNLIQDLILRIAQTSERVVNFKARLITSLI